MAIWYYANSYWWCEIVYALAKMSQLNMIGHLQSTRRASKYFIHILWFVLKWYTFHCCQCLLWNWLFTSFEYCFVPSHISFNLYSQPLFNFKSVSAYVCKFQFDLFQVHSYLIYHKPMILSYPHKHTYTFMHFENDYI